MTRSLKSKPEAQIAPARVRCAIYTRKSTDEGLNQAFNTLDSQRQAAEAYVKSQVGAGWLALPERYDDGGFSGATIVRPAFNRLLSDIDAGRVDAVVVYRLDRLTRSLADFANLMASFANRGVTFASVTEQFSTSTPGGRVFLNVMASFAQYEREVISERTRDKMSAARRKGMWTGGTPSLGYDLANKRLVVNAAEAERVRAIFELYLRQGSLMATVEALNARGWTAKAWTNQAGRAAGGERFSKHSLRRLLSNPLYLGNMPYGDELHDGQHEAIVDCELFDAVGAQLRTHGRDGGATLKNKHGALLKGLVFCAACGFAMTYSYTQRGGRQYGYYVCGRALAEGARACPKSRAPAGELEQHVVAQVRSIGRDAALVEATVVAAQNDMQTRKAELLAASRDHEGQVRKLAGERANLIKAIGQGTPALGDRLSEVDRLLEESQGRVADARAELLALNRHQIDEARLRETLEQFDPVWDELFPKERTRLLSLLLERVAFDGRTGDVEIRFRTGAPAALGRSA